MQRVLAVSRQDVSRIISIIPPEYSYMAIPTKAYGEVPEEFYRLPTKLIEQEVCEADLNYLQIVPYVQIIDTRSLDVYLHRHRVCMFSTGVGTFIEREPSVERPLEVLLAEEIINVVQKELEIVFDNDDLDMVIHSLRNHAAFIYDDALPVSSSHIGIVIPVFINAHRVEIKDKNGIERGHWESLKAIAEQHQSGRIQLETWSIIAINAMIDRFTDSTASCDEILPGPTGFCRS